MTINLRTWTEDRLKSLGCREREWQCYDKNQKKLESQLFYDQFQLDILHDYHSPSSDFLRVCISNLEVDKFAHAVARAKSLGTEGLLRELSDRLSEGGDTEDNFPISDNFAAPYEVVRPAVKQMFISLIQHDPELKKYKDDVKSSKAGSNKQLFDRYKELRART